MILLALLAGATVLPLVVSRSSGRRFHPRLWAGFGVVTIVGAALSIWLSLLLLGAPVIVPLVAGQATADLCSRVLHRLEPGGPALAWTAAVVLGGGIMAVLSGVQRLRRHHRAMRIPPEIGTHADRDGFVLVIVPVAAPLAYSLGGWHPQVVISEDLWVRLDDDELAAVLAHEAAHVRSHHSRWLAVATLVTSALWFVPWVGRSAASITVALERWADEEAAREVGRDTLRRALLCAADAMAAGPGVAALNGADSLLERLSMLEAAPRHARCAFAVASGGLTLALSAAGAAAASGGLSEVLAFLGHLCPI